jgi:DNA-binding MarR family transcriptional regulator
VSTRPVHADASPKAPGERADPDGEALVDALAQSTFVVMGALTRIGAAHDLSLTQLRVLGILRDRRARVTELADFLGLEKSTMSGLVDRAERRGLLERGKNPEDGRAVDVFMTAAGRELAERVHIEVRRALAPTTSRLDTKERHTLTRLLERMLGAAQA